MPDLHLFDADENLAESIDGVLALQRYWTADSSPEMAERARLIRSAIPARVQSLLTRDGIDGLRVQGGDGVGRKTRVPWVRIFDPTYSPSATEGWYIVYLFSVDGKRCYLSLNQGTTTTVRRKLVARDRELIRERVASARNSALAPRLRRNELVEEIDLADPGPLGRGYERGNVFAVCYDAGRIPDEDMLVSHVRLLVPLLELLYEAERSPDSVANEAVSARPSSDDPGSVVEWVRAVAGPELVESRRAAEELARDLLNERAGQMTQVEAEALARHLNQGWWGGVERHTRFSPAFVGNVLDRLIDPIDVFNRWTELIWRGSEEEALRATDEILRNPEAFPGAGRSYPTVLLYLRNPERFAVWLDGTHRGLATLTGFSQPLDRRGGVNRYRRFCEAAQRFARQYDVAPQELDAVLSQAARLAREDAAAVANEAVDMANEVLEVTDDIVDVRRPSHPRDVLEQAVYADSTTLDEWIELLQGRKRQAILYGPPGTGKTFLARHLAAHLAGARGRVEIVQFHPSYTYEHFIEGLHPVEDEGDVRFAPRPGSFKAFCEEASHSSAAFVFIIDELNRAEVGAVLGELMLLLEYRGTKLDLPYSGKKFFVPENVVLLATMNTADRSLALVDFALRRRFHQFAVRPSRTVLEEFLLRQGIDPALALDLFDLVQSRLADAPDFAPGHAYWMLDDPSPAGLSRMWRYELVPYLAEHWFEHPSRIKQLDEEVAALLAAEA